jgi:hypothetical protein
VNQRSNPPPPPGLRQEPDGTWVPEDLSGAWKFEPPIGDAATFGKINGELVGPVPIEKEMLGTSITRKFRRWAGLTFAPGKVASKKEGSRQRETGQSVALARAFNALFPNGPPDRATRSDDRFVEDIQKWLRDNGLRTVSRSTILIEAGRKPRPCRK